MRGIKALATAIALSFGAVSAVALLPTVAMAQASLEVQLEAAIAGLPPGATPQQAQAAIDSVLAMSDATPAAKQAALNNAAASPAAAGKSGVIAALGGTSVAIGIIAANPGISPAALSTALQQQGYPPAVANSVASSGSAAGAGAGGGAGGGGGGGGAGAGAGSGSPSGGGAPGGGYNAS